MTNHLSEEQLLDIYYGDAPEGTRCHIEECAECRAGLLKLSRLLDEIRGAVPVPQRNATYGREVWARLEPRLAKPSFWHRPWIPAGAGVSVLFLVFLAGLFVGQRHSNSLNSGPQPSTTRETAGLSQQDRQAVLRGAIDNHLERSEILLAQLLHGSPAELSAEDEKARARDLLDDNRLLRQAAVQSGDHVHAALLDDLERVFVDLANSPDRLSSADVDELRQRVESQGLLFKVRIATQDAAPTRHKL